MILFFLFFLAPEWTLPASILQSRRKAPGITPDVGREGEYRFGIRAAGLVAGVAGQQIGISLINICIICSGAGSALSCWWWWVEACMHVL